MCHWGVDESGMLMHTCSKNAWCVLFKDGAIDDPGSFCRRRHQCQWPLRAQFGALHWKAVVAGGESKMGNITG